MNVEKMQRVLNAMSEVLDAMKDAGIEVPDDAKEMLNIMTGSIPMATIDAESGAAEVIDGEAIIGSNDMFTQHPGLLTAGRELTMALGAWVDGNRVTLRQEDKLVARLGAALMVYHQEIWKAMGRTDEINIFNGRHGRSKPSAFDDVIAGLDIGDTGSDLGNEDEGGGTTELGFEYNAPIGDLGEETIAHINEIGHHFSEVVRTHDQVLATLIYLHELDEMAKTSRLERVHDQLDEEIGMLLGELKSLGVKRVHVKETIVRHPLSTTARPHEDENEDEDEF